jgi:hypothetical protein
LKTYSIAAVPGATSYSWTPPAGSTIIGGQGTTSVNIEFSTSFPVSDTLRVVAVSACGSSAEQKLKITKNVPGTPGTITVTGGIAKVCPGETRTYTIAPVNGAISYTWTQPTGSTIISGQGTISINVSYNSGFVATDTLRVTANSSCGSSLQRKLAVKRNNPATPGAIVVSGGIAKVCPGETRTYTIPVAAGATSYIWTPPAGSTILSGQGTVSVEIGFNSSFTMNDTLRVVSSNGCGISVQRKLNIVRNNPATPGSIVVSGGIAKVCPGETRTYTIPAAAGATSYVWTPPAGSTVLSGQGTVSVEIGFNSGFTMNDSLRVVSSNGCGISAQRRLNIVRNNPAIPGAISGQNYSLCNLNSIPYAVTNVSGITYNWSFNNPAATVTGGQGTNSITANFGNGYTSTILSVRASNGCGTSLPRNFTIYAKPATPASITGPLTVCVNQQDVPYSITPLVNVINYTWLTPTGSQISDGITTSPANTLTTTSNVVTVDFATTAGNVRVRGNNLCASGSYKTIVTTFTCREALIENLNEDIFNVNIIPNPTRGEFSIQITGLKDIPVKGVVTDVLGNTITHFESGITTTEKFDFNLAPGIYFIRFDDSGRSVVKKIVVQ